MQQKKNADDIKISERDHEWKRSSNTTQRGTGTPHIRQSLFWSIITLAAGDVRTHAHTDTHTERDGCSFHPCAAQNTCHGSLRRKLPPLQKNVRSVRQSRQILAFSTARVNRRRVDAKTSPKNARQTQGDWDCHRIPSSLSHILIKYFVYVLVIGCLRVAVEMRDYSTFF